MYPCALSGNPAAVRTTGTPEQHRESRYEPASPIRCDLIGQRSFLLKKHTESFYSHVRRIFSIFFPLASSSTSLSRYRAFRMNGSSISSTR